MGLTACRIWRAKYPAQRGVVRSRQNILIIRASPRPPHTGTVGFYLDDTPMQASSNAAQLSARGVFDPALFDLARVEVLRGPQGTLYGSSSMGGTIKYVTNQPIPTLRGEQPLDGLLHGRRRSERRANRTVNLPLSDIAAARIRPSIGTRWLHQPLRHRLRQLSQYQSGAVDRRVNSENTEDSGAVKFE